jgi:hypothetical protein
MVEMNSAKRYLIGVARMTLRSPPKYHIAQYRRIALTRLRDCGWGWRAKPCYAVWAWMLEGDMVWRCGIVLLCNDAV